MRIIAKGKEANIKFWKRSAPHDVNYRLMRYHVREDCEEGALIVNTVTGELILLDHEETAMVDALPSPYRPEMDELIEHSFLVPEGFDDLKSVDQLRKILQRFGRSDSITGYCILPTTACNARCFYCYEANYPRHTMTRETAEKVVEYIEAHCGEEKKVRLSWFGGEPLVGMERIDQICDGLTERGIQYSSTMISNGYLFSREIARKAKEKWKLYRVQITLDGTEAVYNRVKAYVGVEGSPFQRVMDNIGLLLDEEISVNVRLNLDFYNADDLNKLIDVLAERFSEREKFSAYVHELFENEGFEAVSHEQEERERLLGLVEEFNSLIDGKEFKQKTKGNGFKDILPSLRTFYCMTDNPASIMINPLGQVGKCEHEIYEHLVGDILDNGHFKVDRLAYWLKPKYMNSCQTCVFFPACGRITTCSNIDDCISVEYDQRLHSVKKRMLSELLESNHKEDYRDEKA